MLSEDLPQAYVQDPFVRGENGHEINRRAKIRLKQCYQKYNKKNSDY